MSGPGDEVLADGRLRLVPGRIARLVLDAPQVRNAMNRAMWRALPQIVARVAADPGIRVVILMTGGEAAFCAGADIGEFDATYATEAGASAANAEIRTALAALRDLPRPVIAQVAGACVGGGVALALACDQIIAAPDASFAVPPARLGIAYSPEDTAMLLERLSAPRVKDLLMSARRLSADEALAWGLIDRIAGPEGAAAAARAQAEILADLSPASIRQAKRTVNALAPRLQDRGLAQDLAQGLADLFGGADFAEGRAAFRDRRKPRF